MAQDAELDPGEGKIRFSTMTEAGETNVRYLDMGQVRACPHFIMVPEHYREGTGCLCSNAAERKKMLAVWGYTFRDFVNVPLID